MSRSDSTNGSTILYTQLRVETELQTAYGHRFSHKLQYTLMFAISDPIGIASSYFTRLAPEASRRGLLSAAFAPDHVR